MVDINSTTTNNKSKKKSLDWMWKTTISDDIGCSILNCRDNISSSVPIQIVTFNECDRLVWTRGDLPFVDGTKQYFWDIEMFPYSSISSLNGDKVYVGLVKSRDIDDWCSKIRDIARTRENCRFEADDDSSYTFLYTPPTIKSGDKFTFHLNPICKNLIIYINGKKMRRFHDLLCMNDTSPYYPVIGTRNGRLSVRTRWTSVENNDDDDDDDDFIVEKNNNDDDSVENNKFGLRRGIYLQ